MRHSIARVTVTSAIAADRVELDRHHLLVEGHSGQRRLVRDHELPFRRANRRQQQLHVVGGDDGRDVIVVGTW
jgi:hypothetical protein